MKICWQGFASKCHSWSIIAQNISRQLIKAGHQVDIFSTNGIEFFPEDLKPNLIGYVEENIPNKIYGRIPDKNYDCQLSYTAMKNFPHYFKNGNKNRFATWCYEFPILPAGFAKQHIHVDKILAPSKFAKDIFFKNGIPDEKIVIIPHGINSEDWKNVSPYKLSTKKTRKIFVNIGQAHLRKNIDGMLEAFGLAFNKNDDVCLVAKVYTNGTRTQPFEVDTLDLFNKFKKKYPNHAEIELITNFVPNISSLYAACDIVFTLSFSEAFYMPGIEAMAANKINISPAYGGQLDFLNKDNSILINGKMIRADTKMQYWEPSPYNGVFSADVNDAAEKLKDLVAHYDNYFKKFSPKMQEILPQYEWSKISKDIINLCI